ncbi:MAG TPA: hypothetical protein VF655_13495 [Allosphingosinicella sp.]|jgi:hypothetical protein
MAVRIRVGLAVMLAWSAIPSAAQQAVNDKYDFKPGDLVQFKGHYPEGNVHSVVSCEARDKPYRQCEMIRQAPDREDHARSFTMDNYKDVMVLVGRGQAQAQAQTAAASPAAPAPVRAPAATAAAAAPVAKGTCPRSPYGGPVPGSRPASAALFRQKITDSITMGVYGPYWYGVRLDGFTVGAPIRNTVSVQPGVGATRVSNGAPPNALLYPVTTTMSVCEGAPTSSSAWRTSKKKYLCFVSKDNEWTCGVSS